MKANRAAREQEGGAEIVGAMLLFGLFVTVIALLNVTSVPAAGLAAEEEHFDRTLSNLNALQTEAEVAGIPSSVGATVARAIDLAPARQTPRDFMSFFLATPAQASGELRLQVDYGNLTVTHLRGGSPTPIVDLGNPAAPFPYGRLTFDPHPVFRGEGRVGLENGGLITTTSTSETMRFSPPITVSVSGDSTLVGIRARVLNGTDTDIGGVAPVRIALVTEEATLSAPVANNARSTTLRLETDHGSAWGAFLNATSNDAGLVQGATYQTTVVKGSGGALDVVTWTVEGLHADARNDVRLTTGLAVYGVAVS